MQTNATREGVEAMSKRLDQVIRQHEKQVEEWKKESVNKPISFQGEKSIDDSLLTLGSGIEQSWR